MILLLKSYVEVVTPIVVPPVIETPKLKVDWLENKRNTIISGLASGLTLVFTQSSAADVTTIWNKDTPLVSGWTAESVHKIQEQPIGLSMAITKKKDVSQVTWNS